MEQVLPKLIHKNQVGFLKKRHGSDNVHQVIDIVAVIHNCKVPMVLLALDAEKAFDVFLKKVLLVYYRGWDLEKRVDTFIYKSHFRVVPNNVT